MTNEELIEELLFEAEALGLREDVLSHAVRLRQLDPKMTPVVSYEKAYHQIVIKDKKK
jgi:hypothetical protein